MRLPTPLILTNDDGIDAQGIRALHEITGGVIIAPTREHSACSHRVTLDAPVRVEQRAEDEFAIHGTPADCARLSTILVGQTPKLLLSGINQGANVGHDVFLSGTVAAAREATTLGIPAISISQYRKGLKEVHWPRAQALAARALEAILEKGHPGYGFWNINLPFLNGTEEAPEVVFCERCMRPLPIVYRLSQDGYEHDRGQYHFRERTPGSDVDVCFRGDIAVSWISL